MAESPSEVWEMIINLKNKSKAAAQTELLTLQVINVKGSVVYRNVFPIKIYGQKFGSNYCWVHSSLGGLEKQNGSLVSLLRFQ